jgi:hypothetical protein
MRGVAPGLLAVFSWRGNGVHQSGFDALHSLTASMPLLALTDGVIE